MKKVKATQKEVLPQEKSLLGKTLRDLNLPATGNSDFSLENYRGQRVVLYFYPKDNTPGCTVESQEFNALLPAFKKLNTVIFGVSRDSLKSHESFQKKFEFKFQLLSDSEEKVCKMLDVIKEKNMYGKKVMGIERSTFVFDENGVIIGEFRKVKPEGHAQMVLNFIRDSEF